MSIARVLGMRFSVLQPKGFPLVQSQAVLQISANIMEFYLWFLKGHVGVF